MFVCVVAGKDIIIFVTPEDHKAPSTVTLPANDDSEPGACATNSLSYDITRLLQLHAVLKWNVVYHHIRHLYLGLH